MTSSAYSLLPVPGAHLPAFRATAGRLLNATGRPAFSHTFGAFAARRFKITPSKTIATALPSGSKLSQGAV